MTGLWFGEQQNPQILVQAKNTAPGPKYQVQGLADQFNDGKCEIKSIFPPVAHPEVNPIEMIWGTVKRSFAANTTSLILSEVLEAQLKEKVNKYTPERFNA